MSAARKAIALTLKRSGIADFTYEARILMEDLAGGGDELDGAAAARLADALARRLTGEPLWRILGAREFWGLSFALSPGTLEPRPDSESLIEAALLHLAERRHEPLRMLDLGTGTGCLLIATLREFPQATGLGIDLSLDAVTTATGNAARNGVAERVAFRHGDWTDGVEERFDLILSNPPYIASAEIAELDRNVREHDPRLALDGGPDGLVAYRALAAALPGHLNPGGHAILEIGVGQEADVVTLMEQAGLRHLDSRRDLGGHIRALVFGHSP
ncbi:MULTISPECIES: peptide chain release factor N(5)-glutamine methyltransferase [unclassified Bosea (in: a-proteobacteria)]|uniref:peptide chain release factor N(5)-glutamine methyltransferase n=1 Tax=unclassified Bosea (in: a-proteobacteria) TaxID=2653178 RepID=UPI000F74F693|nr:MULTISPECIES: peptide chain release factor N(5)-glutamine methyltransferase [unclassified Bosea (in: a-proteobacteria)]AZO81460.1 protein-(glutamine-N5) methyltransferase, release factor-specific [Bosea sp. Tri-49]RXT27759.1 protein-(glutamine-N5) methyltransferase, release factor-specific [Bosea sp. Tri-39]RXT36058.1 protein-(glutamine-N5) methyltransferase, release factor-specific [Bosea sp. Tri-54]